MNHSSTKDYGSRESGWTCEDEIDCLRADLERAEKELVELRLLEMNHEGACVRLKAEVDRLTAQRDDAEACDKLESERASGWEKRAQAAEAKLATVRKDALDEALALVFMMTRGVPDDHGILESIYDRLRAL